MLLAILKQQASDEIRPSVKHPVYLSSCKSPHALEVSTIPPLPFPTINWAPQEHCAGTGSAMQVLVSVMAKPTYELARIHGKISCDAFNKAISHSQMFFQMNEDAESARETVCCELHSQFCPQGNA